MKIIFIADAHLKGAKDPNQEALANFLDGLYKIDKLVILGDLFDLWTDFNQIVYEQYKPVLQSIYALSESGVEIIYIEGNHDFNLGPYFTKTLNVKVYPEACGLKLDDKRIYLAHGDTINMNIVYSLWRGLLRSGLFKTIQKIVPPHIVHDIGTKLSSASRSSGYGKEKPSIEKRQLKFAKTHIKNGFDGVILGHSHTAGVSKGIVKGKPGFYANPGGWINDQSFLIYEDGEFTIKNYIVPSGPEETTYDKN